MIQIPILQVVTSFDISLLSQVSFHQDQEFYLETFIDHTCNRTSKTANWRDFYAYLVISIPIHQMGEQIGLFDSDFFFNKLMVNSPQSDLHPLNLHETREMENETIDMKKELT